MLLNREYKYEIDILSIDSIRILFLYFISMKYIIIISILLFANNLNAEEQTEINDYFPPLIKDEPLVYLLPDNFKPELGLTLSSAAALSSLTFTIANAYITSEKALSDPGSSEVQKGLILTGTFLLTTSISILLVDYFIEELKKSKTTTLEE